MKFSTLFLQMFITRNEFFHDVKTVKVIRMKNKNQKDTRSKENSKDASEGKKFPMSQFSKDQRKDAEKGLDQSARSESESQNSKD